MALSKILPASQEQYAGARNLIINGGFSVNQRNGTSSFTHTASSLTYNADRWFVYAVGANVTGQTVTGTNTNSYQAYKITGASSVTTLNFAQRIEDLNVKHLDNEYITVSFKMYASQALSNIAVGLYFCSGNNSGYGDTSLSNNITVSSGLNTIETTFQLPSVASRGFEVAIVFGGNLPNAATVEIADFQVEQGEQATPFEHRSYADELARCQRYFLNYDLSDGYTGFAVGNAVSNTVGVFSHTFVVPMRSAPTMSTLGLVVTDRIAYDSNLSSINIQGATTSAIAFKTSHTSNSASGGETQQVVANSSATNAYARFDAEL